MSNTTATRPAARSTSTTPSPTPPGAPDRHATTEIDPHTHRPGPHRVRPEARRDPDPGEIVWTWVPYEEHDGRGKDRPVLLVARGKHTGTCSGSS